MNPNITSGISLPVALARFFHEAGYDTSDPENRTQVNIHTGKIQVVRIVRRKVFLLTVKDYPFEMTVVLVAADTKWTVTSFDFEVLGQAAMKEAEELADKLLAHLNKDGKGYRVRVILAAL